MVDSGQRALTNHGSIESLMALWQTFYKELMYLDCAHLVDEVTTAHQKFASPSEIEDLKQVARTRLWEFIDDAITPPTDFKKIAKRVINSQLRDTRRSSSDQRRVIQRLKNLTLNEIEQTPNQKIEQQEVLQAIRTACLNLNQPLAEVLKKLNGLGDTEEHEVNEVAAQQQVTRQTIRNWRNRAHEILKQNPNLKDLAS